MNSFILDRKPMTNSEVIEERNRVDMEIKKLLLPLIVEHIAIVTILLAGMFASCVAVIYGIALLQSHDWTINLNTNYVFTISFMSAVILLSLPNLGIYPFKGKKRETFSEKRSNYQQYRSLLETADDEMCLFIKKWLTMEKVTKYRNAVQNEGRKFLVGEVVSMRLNYESYEMEEACREVYVNNLLMPT